ncbi:CBS domain-containing protein [Promicromonospora iranensis]|uniref:Signal-transduction protein with cAMP-binding, CBS, and nucleotidyltransferase domain n=1 Tax=Promicromonospora iranensis TaxID=1105144 RepID=A0ABU2CTM9_9MICO|nr:CBS domain-containing protein [Promicromonospora iranensis]MDR7384714.1 signal-transduction protein with cAMP-binding, CBS, and nucleotidyltransferase domain [Promicromonospora iranensis]
MVQTVADVMTPAPTTVDVSDSVQVAARAMAAEDVGALVVQSESKTVGIVTDRDLVVRGLAEGLGLDATIKQVATEQLVTVGPSDPAETAVEVMRSAAVRRVPVMDGDVAVGIVAIGDLAVTRDPSSALADISEEKPNN